MLPAKTVYRTYFTKFSTSPHLSNHKMVSDASKKKAAQKKAAAAAKRGAKTVAAAASKKAAAIGTVNGNSSSDNLANGMGSLAISDRTCTGVLCSHPLSRDIRLELRLSKSSMASMVEC
ncbi:unnamed protein product [Lactuca saligna]|uniref:Uncharacterized protein n=1 Tax=Lactuca saligna TaxID=75948 RepID=A0AA35YDC4_LACSI|nr:unnamed protein product [Lactuca saligna]